MSSGNSRPRVRLPLNGVWQLQPGEKGHPPTIWEHEVPVPALVDAATPPYNHAATDYHWYRRNIVIPDAWRRDLAFLVIDQAMFGTDVWLNGWRVGGDIACYTSQHYDVRGALRYGLPNELVIRIGGRHTLPPESAVGKDQERMTFIPGIWGDVHLVLCGNPRVSWVQTIPHLERSMVEVRVWVENRSVGQKTVSVCTKVFEKETGVEASQQIELPATIEPGQEIITTFIHVIRNVRSWSPDDPFLYEVESWIEGDQEVTDRTRTTFGMRDFTIRGSEFVLNGQRTFLRGGNIAFHRFLSDPERETLPWDPVWIKKVLIDIPKEHNFNFFRNHLGQMYNLWYDIADSHGILLQNEWQFWTTTGSRGQIRREFTQWIKDNWNHPSIVIWDALNECSDSIIQNEIVPEMKKLDPSRPWESVDFIEDHPYLYSLGPVLIDRRLGFTRSLDDIERSESPAVINEFLWWWLDSENSPTMLMPGVLERWLGPEHTTEEILHHQVFLAQELVELFRRMRVDAVQPFVYLSNSTGPTGHWFSGSIRELRPKAVLSSLRNAFAPFGLSLELWDRHFFAGEHRTMQLYLINDHAVQAEGKVVYGICRRTGEWMTSKEMVVRVAAADSSIIPVIVGMPATEGSYTMRAELYEHGSDRLLAASVKPIHVFGPLDIPPALRDARVGVIEEGNEVYTFLSQCGIQTSRPEGPELDLLDVVVVVGGAARSKEYRAGLTGMNRYVRSGHSAVFLEPECGVETTVTVRLLDSLDLQIEKRLDTDRGGYDSYVFAEDPSHPVWNGIEKSHLKMFNGAYGGEIVSQHDLMIGVESRVLARCGLRLSTVALSEAPYGSGRVLISRIQTRGRLLGTPEGESLYGRRKDPVAQRYLLNLLAWGVTRST